MSASFMSTLERLSLTFFVTLAAVPFAAVAAGSTIL